MRYYVDFENVVTAGLAGIENLTEDDCVRIYYSNDPNVNMETVINIKKSVSKIQFLKLCDSLKKMNISNALDIVILTDISRILPSLGNNLCVVISKDKGYDNVIAELNAENGVKKIFRALSISEAIMQNFVSDNTEPESKTIENKTGENNISVNNPPQTLKKTSVDETALENLFKNELSQYKQQKSKIIQIVKSSKSRTAINNSIGKFFHNNDQKNIMGSLRPIIENLPGK